MTHLIVVATPDPFLIREKLGHSGVVQASLARSLHVGEKSVIYKAVESLERGARAAARIPESETVETRWVTNVRTSVHIDLPAAADLVAAVLRKELKLEALPKYKWCLAAYDTDAFSMKALVIWIPPPGYAPQQPGWLARLIGVSPGFEWRDGSC